MDLGNISGRTLDLPAKTEVYVVDFLNKALLLKATIENSTFDPEVIKSIKKAQELQAKIYKEKKTASKRTKKTA